MYAETSEKKSHARTAFALLCGLAVCCSVMYITADGSDEYVHEIVKGFDAGSSVGSTDVLKAGQIYSETPDGRMRLMDYFNNVEKEISDEVSNRKSDISSVRAQMARDFAYNAAQRSALKKEMLINMARNAKIARDNLNHAMRKTQRTFARAAYLATRRFRANQKRHKHTLRMMARDKKAAARRLRLATSSWQKATAAWASATNAKIDQSNRHAAANAAQIEENAKKARKDLEATMTSWDNSVSTFKTDEKNANNRLAVQFAAQGKQQRAYAFNKIKGLVASTAAQFNDVHLKMAKNRHEVDMALRQASMRFEAALNAQKALENQRYAKTVANIAAARAEAAHKVADATTEFKIGLLNLGSEVAHQVAKINDDVDATAGVVRSDAAAQAKVNANVNAEMSRMVKLGNKQYRKHLKDDAELEKVIASDNEQTNKDLNQMASSFNAALSSVRATLKRDRAHAEKQVQHMTGAVFAQLAKNEEAQAAKNAKMKADIRRERLDAIDNTRRVKKEFQKKIKHLGSVVAENDRKADAKIETLTGVVAANAAKSKKGREEIHMLENANRKELDSAIRDAIAKGEKRAALVEERGNKMDADTKWLVNNKLREEISTLRKATTGDVEALAMENADARAKLKKEMMYAVSEARDIAKADLKREMKLAAQKMEAFEKKAAETHANSAMERKQLAASIAANAKSVSDTLVAAQKTAAAAMLAFEEERDDKLEKTNHRIDAMAQKMKDHAKTARAEIAALTEATEESIKTEADRASKATEEFSSADAARQAAALKFLKDEMEKAQKESDLKFGAAQEKMAEDRAHADQAMASSFKGLNDALAKQAAINDSRFESTVANIKAARAEATEAVQQLRKDFSTKMVLVNALVKNTESKLASNIAKVSGEVAENKALQDRVNERTSAELNHIEKLANDRHSEDKRARGALRTIMDENKAAAAEEVAALKADLQGKLGKLRAKNAANALEMKKDLTQATKKFSEGLAAQQKAQNAAHAELATATSAAVAASASALASAQKGFNSKITGLTNTVAAHAKEAEEGITKLTGVVRDISKANAADRQLIRDQTKAMQADLQKALDRAISIGEAKAKATEQRIAEHLKNTHRELQVTLIEEAEKAADDVFNLIQGNRQKIADNYLSLKAYAVSAADKIQDYRAAGKGAGLSSIGDLLVTVGSLGSVKPTAAEGPGMGGDKLQAIFSGKEFKVARPVASINGLVNEFTKSTNQVRNRWPMGLGKYLLDKLEISMEAKGVLQVDKVEGHHGNYVYMNGRSVGLSNKLSDFATLAVRMSTYEGVLAKLTSKVSPPVKQAKGVVVKPPEWQGD